MSEPLTEMTGLLGWAIYISLAAFSLTFVAAFIRVVRGPSLPDRVVAVDLVSYITMAFLGTYAILTQQDSYVDAALVLGLLAFMGTVALARYIERRWTGRQRHVRED